ncbi:hypothetical protein TNCV_3887531 [Trichonephila clavipes]|nr:hypothetical protein TNCV_3887531 [Trichonephila clavipes]
MSLFWDDDDEESNDEKYNSKILVIAKRFPDDVFENNSFVFFLCCWASFNFIIPHKLANIWNNKDSLCQLGFGYTQLEEFCNSVGGKVNGILDP